jgi:Holliday junction resolvasome RuvABC endonuclease subunit
MQFNNKEFQSVFSMERPASTYRIIGLDSGAKRLGISVIDKHKNGSLDLIYSDIFVTNQEPTEKYMEYKSRLCTSTAPLALELFMDIEPDLIIAEQIPIIFSSGNPSQRILGFGLMCALQALSVDQNWEWKEIAATTVKKKITGNGKATKVAIRNAVIKQFPELAERKKELTDVADEADAIAIALSQI